jgi:hypothetical protein
LVASVHHELAAAPTEGAAPTSLSGAPRFFGSWFEHRKTSTKNIGAGITGGQG